VRKLISYVNPKAPKHLYVTGVDGPAAHLAWTAGRRGDARIVAYRVFRGGVTYRQVRRTTRVDVPISNSRTYVFGVAAVDAHGKLSRTSPVVRVDTDHRAPPPPATVIASAITDSELTLSWSPSIPARGRIAGYRIYRDGKVLRQVQGLSTRVTNLAAGTAHDFTVAAVDSSGWLSAPSRPAKVSTAPPVPSTGNAHAFLLASHGASWDDFRAHYRQIGVVYPTYFDCASNGSLEGGDQPFVTHWAQQRGVKVLPRFNCQRVSVVTRIVEDAALREQWLDAMVAAVERSGFDGVQLDFEQLPYYDRSAFTSFATELAGRLHARGKLLSVSVSPKVADVPNHPRSSAFDYLALAQQADWVFVMGWGIHWQTSTPGAVDDMTWFSRVMTYLGTMPQPGRFVLGTALYGLDWPSGGGASNPAIPREYADTQALIARVGATPRHDSLTDNWTFSYTDSGGAPHEVWYPDAATTHERLRMARERGLGVGFWRLGNEDQRIWSDALVRGGG
jgi:spore germination protein YaaH